MGGAETSMACSAVCNDNSDLDVVCGVARPVSRIAFGPQVLMGVGDDGSKRENSFVARGEDIGLGETRGGGRFLAGEVEPRKRGATQSLQADKRQLYI
ncbi:hypothetical protein Tco_1156939 [Tanacetum coccineum]|uniref:Uncharacterized protein n=1 Tax=Tanacetum coccineum TaxID=301880 RepID=A0ABQ5AJY8_9ASTR